MLYKWNEIKLSTFKDILKDFWMIEDWTKDKILEVQSLHSVISSNREFFGMNLCKLGDIKERLVELNIENLSSEDINEVFEIMNKGDILFHSSIYQLESQITFIPISIPSFIGKMSNGLSEYAFERFWEAFEKDKLETNWFTKTNGTYFIYSSNLLSDSENVPEDSKLVRMRTVDRSDFEYLVENLQRDKKLPYIWTKDDLNPSLITPSTNLENIKDLVKMFNS